LATDDNQVVFEQGLKLLSTTSGAQSIAANSSGTVVLDDWHDNNGVSTYTKLYDIIYAKPDTLFPIKSQGAILNHSTQDYTPVTVTNDEVNAMKQTEAFTQTIAAYPTSQLAQSYTAALQSTTNSATGSDDIDDKISAFFASTQQYQDVTLDTIIALKSYYDVFPMVWAGYQSTKTYYFYSSDGSTVKANGSLVINIPSTITLDKSLPGFSFTYTDANNNKKPLLYVNGQFVDDATSDVPNICLNGTFVLKSTLTKVDTDTMIIPILSGTIFSDQVLGYDTPLSKDGGDSDGWGGLYTLLHPKDAQGWLQLFLTFVGVVMGVDFVVKQLKTVKDGIIEAKERLGDLFSDSDVEAIKAEAKANGGLNDPKYQQKMKKIKAEDAAEKSLPDQMNDANAKYQDRMTEDWRTAMDTKLDKLSDMLEKMLDSGHATTAMEDADDSLEDAYGTLESSSTADLSAQMSEISEQIGNLQTNITQQFEAMINKVKGDVLDALNESKAAAEEASQTADNVDQDAKDAKEGEVPDNTEPESTGLDLGVD
jgi:hypothetical protein